MRQARPRGGDDAEREFAVFLFLLLYIIYIYPIGIIQLFSLRMPMALCRWPPADRRWQVSRLPDHIGGDFRVFEWLGPMTACRWSYLFFSRDSRRRDLW